jgi:hypothetical protein
MHLVQRPQTISTIRCMSGEDIRHYRRLRFSENDLILLSLIQPGLLLSQPRQARCAVTLADAVGFAIDACAKQFVDLHADQILPQQPAAQ